MLPWCRMVPAQVHNRATSMSNLTAWEHEQIWLCLKILMNPKEYYIEPLRWTDVLYLQLHYHFKVQILGSKNGSCAADSQGCGEEDRLLSTLLLSARWQGLQRWRLLLFSTLSNSSTTTTTFTTNPPPSTPPIQHPHHLQSTTFCTISIVATTTYTAFLFTTTIFIITYTASIFTTTSTPLGLAQNPCLGLWGGEWSLVEWQIWMINCYSIIVPINAYPCALSGVQQI